MKWNPKPSFPVSKEVNYQSDAQEVKKKPKQQLTIDLSGVDDLLKLLPTLRASVWEGTEAIEQLKTQVDNLDKNVAVELQKLTDQQDRIETFVSALFNTLDRMNKRKMQVDSHLEKVLTQLSDALNQ